MAGREESALHAAIREGHDLEAIRSIVESDPRLLRRRSGLFGYLPIHAAIERGSPPGVTRYLLHQWPESVRECTNDSSKNLPAHVACRKQFHFGPSDLETARLVVEAWPGALRARNACGYLPLHLSHDLALIRYLVEAWPESVQEADDSGRTALHWAVSNGAELGIVRFYVTRCPQLVRARSKHEETPLHCISGQTKREVVQYLVAQWQETLVALDSDGRVPLHAAMDEGDVTDPVTMFLVDCEPQSVRARAKDGSLPLHLAVQNKRYEYDSDEDYVAIRRMVDAWPESLRVATDEGLLPLHCAAESANIPVVRILARQWPESVQMKSGEGWLAVHLTLQCNHCLLTDEDEIQDMYETARFLIDQYPQSAFEATNEGYLPLHVAAMVGYGFRADGEGAQMELDFFRYLVGRAPAAIRVASNALLFPFQYAIQKGFLAVPALQFLAEQWPDALRSSDEDGRTAMHMAVSRDHLRMDYVRYVAELRPQLLGTTDRSGATPLHVAVAQIQSESDVLLGSSANEESRAPVERKLRQLLEIVRFLVEQRPQSLAEADHRGSLPLHVAAGRVLPALEMARLLVEARPEVLGAADRRGSLPLHVAVACSPPRLELVRLLVEQRPEALGEADVRGAIPLHVAVARSDHPRSLELVQFLVERSPGSVRTENARSGALPLFLAATADATLDVLFFLATTWPDAISSGSRQRRRPRPSQSSKRCKRS